MPSHADNELEHRREHVILGLHMVTGNVPSDDEVDEHLAEMDSRHSNFGATRIHQHLDLERADRARVRKEAQARQDAATQAEDASRQRQEQKDKEAQDKEDAALAAAVKQDDQQAQPAWNQQHEGSN